MAKIHWPMDFDTFQLYAHLSQEIAAAQADHDKEREQAAIDQLRSLPNFPHNADPEHDHIVPLASGWGVEARPVDATDHAYRLN